MDAQPSYHESNPAAREAVQWLRVAGSVPVAEVSALPVASRSAIGTDSRGSLDPPATSVCSRDADAAGTQLRLQKSSQPSSGGVVALSMVSDQPISRCGLRSCL